MPLAPRGFGVFDKRVFDKRVFEQGKGEGGGVGGGGGYMVQLHEFLIGQALGSVSGFSYSSVGQRMQKLLVLCLGDISPRRWHAPR